MLDLVHLGRYHVACHNKRAVRAKIITLHQGGDVDVVADVDVRVVWQAGRAGVKVEADWVGAVVSVPLQKP